MSDTNNLSQFSVSDKVINDVINKNSLFIDINGTVSICQTKCGQEVLNCNGNDIQFTTMTNYGKMLSLNPVKNNKCSVKLSLDSRNEIVDQSGSAFYTFEKTFITLPSMHKLNGKSFDMEIYSIFSSKQNSGENLYVCLCTLVNGVDNLDTSNEKYIQYKLLNELFTNNKIPEKGITSDINGKLSHIDLNHFMPSKGKKSFYQYNHPDNTAVNFRIFDNPLNILNSVIANLKKSLFNEKTFEYNNFVNSLKNNLNPKKGLYFFYTNDLSETYTDYAKNNKEEFKENDKENDKDNNDDTSKKTFEKIDIDDKTDPDPDPKKLNEKFDDESDAELLAKTNQAVADSIAATNNSYKEGIVYNNTFPTTPFVANTYLIISLACLIIFNYIIYILCFYYYNNFSFEWHKFDDFRSMTTSEIQLFLLGVGSNPEILRLLHWKVLYYVFFIIKVAFVVSLIIVIGLYINNLKPMIKTIIALLCFVLVFTILSITFIILWSKDRSKLGFDYISSNKDNLLFTDYFSKKLSFIEKIKFIFTGSLNDIDSSILNELKEQIGGAEENRPVMPGIDNLYKNDPKPIDHNSNPIEGLKSIFGFSSGEQRNNVSKLWYFIIISVVFGMYFLGGIILKVLDNSQKSGNLNVGIFIMFTILITIVHFILPLFKFWNLTVYGNTANKVSQLPFSNIEHDFKIAPQIISTAPLNLRSKLQKKYNDLKNKYDELHDDYLFLKHKYKVLDPEKKNLVLEIMKLLNIINNLKNDNQFKNKDILEKLRDEIN